ncbi:MAG: hypothetical protein QOF14_752 [Hyphomicrobiales bacterium]|jgi:hypothetical protein|nr:hypothetical protein [Hyphomicrobiales bacterium]
MEPIVGVGKLLIPGKTLQLGLVRRVGMLINHASLVLCKQATHGRDRLPPFLIHERMDARFRFTFVLGFKPSAIIAIDASLSVELLALMELHKRDRRDLWHRS